MVGIWYHSLAKLKLDWKEGLIFQLGYFLNKFQKVGFNSILKNKVIILYDLN